MEEPEGSSLPTLHLWFLYHEATRRSTRHVWHAGNPLIQALDHQDICVKFKIIKKSIPIFKRLDFHGSTVNQSILVFVTFMHFSRLSNNEVFMILYNQEGWKIIIIIIIWSQCELTKIFIDYFKNNIIILTCVYILITIFYLRYLSFVRKLYVIHVTKASKLNLLFQ